MATPGEPAEGSNGAASWATLSAATSPSATGVGSPTPSPAPSSNTLPFKDVDANAEADFAGGEETSKNLRKRNTEEHAGDWMRHHPKGMSRQQTHIMERGEPPLNMFRRVCQGIRDSRNVATKKSDGFGTCNFVSKLSAMYRLDNDPLTLLTPAVNRDEVNPIIYEAMVLATLKED